MSIIENFPIAQFEMGSMKNFVYSILDWENRLAVVVDPQKNFSKLVDELEKYFFKIQGLLFTHSHHDHVAGIPEALDSFPHLPLMIHQKETHRLKKEILNQAQIQLIHDGQTLSVGNISVEVIHTPGHSAGGCCFLVQKKFLLTGDTLFIRACGRTDLETGSDTELYQSLNRLKLLPPTTLIFPGHHYVSECFSTLEKELLENEALTCENFNEFLAIE